MTDLTAHPAPELIIALSDEATGLPVIYVIDDPEDPGYLDFEIDVSNDDYSTGEFALSTDEVIDLRDALNLYLAGASA